MLNKLNFTSWASRVEYYRGVSFHVCYTCVIRSHTLPHPNSFNAASIIFHSRSVTAFDKTLQVFLPVVLKYFLVYTKSAERKHVKNLKMSQNPCPK